MRMATPADLPLLREVEAAADTMFQADLPNPAPVEALAASLAILVEGDPPVGFARVEEIDGLAHLEQLSVHPDHGRQGIGGALVEAACDWAREHGYAAMTLMTFAEVPWNAPFYAKHGFVPLDELTPGLAKLREKEIQFRLHEIGTRVAMRRALR